MTFQYKVDFNGLEWESPMEGVRHKSVVRDGLRLRLVEYSKAMAPHWCEKGHQGYLIQGRMEIEFKGTKISYDPGDGIFIPDGAEHKHRARVLSDKALVFLQERI